MNTQNLPFSEACERNKDPILNILKQYFEKGDILEIGHGTGQHAIYFCRHLDVRWFPSDIPENLWMLEERRKVEFPKNLETSISIKIGNSSLKEQAKRNFSGVFTANTLHIMKEKEVLLFCEEVHQVLEKQGLFLCYGPFKFEGSFTSESNQRFDEMLRGRDPNMGIRDFEKIHEVLSANKISFLNRIDLPANNQILVWEKK